MRIVLWSVVSVLALATGVIVAHNAMASRSGGHCGCPAAANACSVPCSICCQPGPCPGNNNPTSCCGNRRP